MPINTDKIEGISFTQDISYIFGNGASRLYTTNTAHTCCNQIWLNETTTTMAVKADRKFK